MNRYGLFVGMVMMSVWLAWSGVGWPDSSDKTNCDLPVDATKCSFCKEEITPESLRFATFMREGKVKRSFHDIGSMLVWREGQCMSTGMLLDQHLLVKDYQTGEEAPISEAFFAVKTGVATPHGHGIVAFKKRESAEALSREYPGSSVMTYEQLLEANIGEVSSAGSGK